MRNPWLLPIAPRLIKSKYLYRIYLVLYMLYSEYLVAEQAGLYAKAQGLGGPRYWTGVDFTYRVITKGFLRLYQVVFARFLERFSSSERRLRMALQMGDERVIAHVV